jgi:hypothetical protein
MKDNLLLLAKILHAATSVLPRDDGSLVVAWDHLSLESQELAVKAIEHIFENDLQTPEEFHNLWMEGKIDTGWTYGKFSLENKTHPAILPYNELSDTEKLKDIIWIALTKTWKLEY